MSDPDAATPVDAGDGQDGRTRFEIIEQSELDDAETYIIHRGATCFALLNAYPYTS